MSRTLIKFIDTGAASNGGFIIVSAGQFVVAPYLLPTSAPASGSGVLVVNSNGTSSFEQEKKSISIAITDSATAVTVADGVFGFAVPSGMDGWKLNAVRAAVHTAGTGSGSTDFQVRRRRAGANTDLLSTKVTLSASEYTIADGVIDTNANTVNAGDILYADVDAITATTAPTGASLTLDFVRG